MAYSIDPIQDNCYPGTTVLVNKLHIHDEAALQEAEALATYVNASKLEQCPLEGVFDFAHYKAIHQFLFSDLYDWAGQIRTVDISKKGTRFCSAEKDNTPKFRSPFPAKSEVRNGKPPHKQSNPSPPP